MRQLFRVDPKQALRDHVERHTGAPIELSAEARAIAALPIEPGFSGTVIVGIAQAVEAGLMIALGLGIYAFYLWPETPWLYVPATLVTTLFTNVLLNAARAHRIAAYRTLISQTSRVLAVWASIFLVVMAAVFLLKGAEFVSRGWLILWFGLGALLLIAYRIMLRYFIVAWTADGKLRRRTVIVGGGHDAEALVEAIRRSAAADIQLLGLFDDRGDQRSPESVADLPKLGRVAELVEFARQTRVDLVLVSMPLSAEKRVLEMLTRLWVLPVDIRLSAHMSSLRFSSSAYSYVGEVPVFDLADRPISDWNLVFKWGFDRLVALAALVALAPLMIIVALAIKLDSKGPVFFKQKRHGFNNELIEIFKFRSMRTDMSDIDASKLVTRADPRVTRVGRFIRKTSIDELPQFFNVLRGDLSVVGPRPHALQAKADNTLYYEAVEGYFARHKVKPGITGWAQIHGWRGETDTIEKIMKRVQHDLYYIENWSIFLDVYILMMTPISLFSKSENAF